MAELNFGLLTPPGSQSIGNAFVQGMDQAAVARAQENQNALSQYTLSKAKREDEVNNRLLSDLRAAKTPEEQMQAYVYAGRAKDALAIQSDILKNTKLRNEILAQPGAQANTQAQTAVRHGTVMKNEATRVLADPTLGNAMQAVVNFGRATGQDVTQELATITAMGNDPVKIANWAKGHAVTGEQLLKQSVVKTVDTDMGGSISRQTYDAQGVAVGAPTIIPKTPTLGSVPGIAQADIARARAIDEGIPVPGAAPAQPGAPVTPAAFPRDTAVQQTTRMTDATAIKRQELANEQIKLANATQKLALPAAANDPDIRRFYEERFKEATNNIDALNKELGGRTNNMPGAAAAAPGVPNALIERSPKDQRDAKVVASITTDSAGNVRRFNKFGDQIGEVIKGVGKPSATYEKTQQLQKQLTQDLALTIRELENAVKPKGLIEQSTGSGAGALVDTSRAFFGDATEGAIAVATLKPIYDRVLKLVPRFEGPQSNNDTKSYENAAGQLANPAVPNKTKLAAGKEILRIMKERQAQFISRDMVELPNVPADSAAPPTAPVDMPSAAAAELARRAAAKR